jgi:phage baseplate assembly protein W
MPQYIGFSTINANQPKSTNRIATNAGGFGGIVSSIIPGKRYRLLDENLVVQDFINALNIMQGQKVGQPEYGCRLWSFIFEPNTADTQMQIEAEMRRVGSLDPRLILDYIRVYPQDHGILLEVQMAIAPFNNPAIYNIFFDPNLNKAILKQ